MSRFAALLFFIGLGLAMVLFGWGHVNAQTHAKDQEFIVTFPHDFSASEPIHVRAPNRIWAVTALGLTVWTAKEWERAQELDRKIGDSGVAYTTPTLQSPVLDNARGSGCIGCTTTNQVALAVPFDVPPKEWKGPDTAQGGISEGCPPPQELIGCEVEVGHAECTDKKRVLMSSEDGVKHCYGFYLLAPK